MKGRDMEKKLSEAAMEGNVSTLKELLLEDPLILDRTIVSCVSETPLHVSSMLGHLALTKELLSLKPELASELDSHGSSPLHLASAKGHLEIVKELLLVDPEACLVRNQDGRTPLHLAALKGRVMVVSEMVGVKSESTLVLTDRGETVLHLCVGNHNRLESLRVLFEAVGKEIDLVNWKDCDGNTILHIAVAKKHIETIKFLLAHTGVDVNALNKNNSTALDILIGSPRDLRDMEIDELLQGAGALTAKDIPSIVQDWAPTKVPQITRSLTSPLLSKRSSETKKPGAKQKDSDWLGRKRSALMVVASLIATVAFQAGITPPGGVWQDDLKVDDNGNPVENPHSAGTSVMAYTDSFQYGQFMIFNTIAFLASLSIILLLVSGLPIKRRRWVWIQMVILWVAVTAQVVTYFIALRYMSPDLVQAQIMLRKVTEISVLTWLTLMAVVFIGNILRMNLWILRKYGYLKEKEAVPQAATDDEHEEV
ncbi:ankyrin repeat-containing protein BDA1-like isoform X1 [Juglans microcarpa x Juglans regia]|uniref:ankyrin repeat-containing protein BDA1-like isoform X1 n=1 Tax=Juglans microcarpa x Juglans regia TaxID=2249226 RepID=UPI001B7F5E9C|nr:ankyrin repeat-containing protein BDA1-like isoform X1 [Juglans microcarpa x Juglans regia]